MLLLDIDHVLMGWNNKKHYRPGHLGWEKWRHIPNRIYFNVVADDMLEFLKEHFQDKIVWLTTWLSGGICNSDFAPETNFGPFPTVTSLFLLDDGTNNLDAYDLKNKVAAKAAYEWWKLAYVCHLIEADKLPDKVIWIDDDISGFMRQVDIVLDTYDVRDKFCLVVPSDTLTRSQIEKALEWYNEVDEESMEQPSPSVDGS